MTDDKIPRDIMSCSHENATVSIGIVFDLRGSTTNKIAKARAAVREFPRYLEDEDEVFLVTFGDHAQQRTEFAADDTAVLNELLLVGPKGTAALFDAVAIAVQAMRKARNDRRVLLVVSKGPQIFEAPAEMTGGEHHIVGEIRESPGLAAKMGLSLHPRYLLGYQPTPSGMPGKLRRRTRVTLLKAPASCQLNFRNGYRVP